MKLVLSLTLRSWVLGLGAWVGGQYIVSNRRSFSIIRFLFFTAWAAPFSFFVFSFSAANAQTLQVITKSIEKTFVADKIDAVQILAERADIEINTWSKNEIKIVVELIAKHPDRAVATNDLAYFKYVIEAAGRNLHLRNLVVLTSNSRRPEANLKARYTLLLPASCAVVIQNSFGKIEIKGLENNIKVKSEFCTSTLQQLKGKITLETYFGDVKAEDLDGTISLTSDRTDWQLKNLKGRCQIRAQYGTFEINTDKTLVKIDLKTDNTVVRFVPQLTNNTK